MRRTISLVAILALPAMLVMSPSADAQGKKGIDKDLDRNSEKMIRAGQVVGKVVAVYEDKRKIRVKISQVVKEINTGSLQSIQNAQVQMAVARARGDYQGMISAQRSMLQARANLYTVKVVHREPEIQVMDDAVIRMRSPRADFDDKGRPKKYTKAELKELKGSDPKLPGYNADFGDISTDQIVVIQLVRKKTPPIKLPRGKNKEEMESALIELLAEAMPQASMVIIEREALPVPNR